VYSTGVARSLFIVVRQLPNVFEHLRRQFGEEPDVEVLVDRRREQRRKTPHRPLAGERERRHGERRQNREADEQLRSLGYVFIRVGR
jgi:hypothetical protein